MYYQKEKKKKEAVVESEGASLGIGWRYTSMGQRS